MNARDRRVAANGTGKMPDWKDVAHAEELGPGESRLVEANGVQIAVVNVDGELFAIADRCTHDGSPLLGSGIEPRDLIEGRRISCPRHGAQFCLRTGAALTPPAWEPAPIFPLRVVDVMIQVRTEPDG
jgi:3-phenylpropionate/trans-cinnamate dioxygenase ferredoxin subunit